MYKEYKIIKRLLSNWKNKVHKKERKWFMWKVNHRRIKKELNIIPKKDKKNDIWWDEYYLKFDDKKIRKNYFWGYMIRKTEKIINFFSLMPAHQFFYKYFNNPHIDSFYCIQDYSWNSHNISWRSSISYNYILPGLIIILL